MAIATNPAAASIDAVVTRACGCVEDHGTVSFHHPDPDKVVEWLHRRLVDFHGHSHDDAHATVTLLTPDPDQDHSDMAQEILASAHPRFAPIFLVQCDGTVCTSPHQGSK